MTADVSPHRRKCFVGCQIPIAFWASAMLAAVGILAVGGIEIAARTLSAPLLTRFESRSQIVVDVNGDVMRVFLSSDDHWRLLTRIQDTPPDLLKMLITYEDQRFFSHSGFDGLAMLRALAQVVRHGRIVSGASTLTMQVARLLEPMPRGIPGKIWQIIRARQLELHYSKQEILTFYLTLAPYGGNIAGLRAAALAYFRKNLSQVTAAEGALLLALPQAPEQRRFDRNHRAAARAGEHIIRRLAAAGRLPAGFERRLPSAPEPAPFRSAATIMAPHLAERLRLLKPGADTIRSLIEPAVQRLAERVVKETLPEWLNRVNVAVLVVRNHDQAVVGYLGGGVFADSERAGHIDLAVALRSPGSTLKPFIYGLGFEQRVIHPKTIITDAPLGYGTYEPRNFSGDYSGDLSVHDALIQSINTGAVAILNRIGPTTLMTRLEACGVALKVNQSNGIVGLAVGLGGVGVRLVDLVVAYSALANGGIARGLRFQPDDEPGQERTLLSPDAAWAVVDILADMPPPTGFLKLAAVDGGRRVAYKTGTSYGYRDAWAVGFDQTYTIGIWVGRPDGAPNVEAYGLTTAAPLLYRIFEGLESPQHDVASTPPWGSTFDPEAGA